MHHPISGINSLILSVSLASHVLIFLLIHLSAHLYYHYHSHQPSLLHSFTLGSKPTFWTNPSHLRLLLPTALPLWQRDWTGRIMLIVLFLVSHFNFLFVPCGGLSWLLVSFLLHVKYTLSYHIIFSSYFAQNNVFHPYNTSTKDSLHYEIYRSTLGQRSIRYKGSLLWNSLSDELKDIVGTGTFINKLKAFLINKWHSNHWLACVPNY